jgi:hypothetical protein
MWFTTDGRLLALLDHIRMVPRNHFRYFDETMRDVCSIDLSGQRSAIALNELYRPRIAFPLPGLALAHLTTRRSYA